VCDLWKPLLLLVLGAAPVSASALGSADSARNAAVCVMSAARREKSAFRATKQRPSRYRARPARHARHHGRMSSPSRARGPTRTPDPPQRRSGRLWLPVARQRPLGRFGAMPARPASLLDAASASRAFEIDTSVSFRNSAMSLREGFSVA